MFPKNTDCQIVRDPTWVPEKPFPANQVHKQYRKTAAKKQMQPRYSAVKTRFFHQTAGKNKIMTTAKQDIKQLLCQRIPKLHQRTAKILPKIDLMLIYRMDASCIFFVYSCYPSYCHYYTTHFRFQYKFIVIQHLLIIGFLPADMLWYRCKFL